MCNNRKWIIMCNINVCNSNDNNINEIIIQYYYV